MSSLRQAKLERAKQYVLDHPDESKAYQAVGAGVSVALIAIARAELIRDGVVSPSRKPNFKSLPTPIPRDLAPNPTGLADAFTGAVSKPAGMLDHTAMTAMADMLDAIEDGTMDETEVHRRLLRQCIRFAFDPGLHPDTRMSASQMWAKLRDMAKAHNLGPGVPLTRDAARARMADLMTALGPEDTLAAVHAAFEVKESADDQAQDDQAPPPGVAAETPRPA